MRRPASVPGKRGSDRRFVVAIGGPHDGNTVLVYEPLPLELVIDRCQYVLDEDGTSDHPGPIYVHVPDT